MKKTICDKFDFVVKSEYNGKEYEIEGRHDGTSDFWLGKVFDKGSDDEIGINVNIFGGLEYGESESDIFAETYVCTKSENSKTGWGMNKAKMCKSSIIINKGE